MITREKADNRERMVKRAMNLVDYNITPDNDIMFVSGPYAGRKVRALWIEGSDQRDYIVKSLARRGDKVVTEILKELYCN